MAVGRIRWWHWIPRLHWRLVGVVADADEVPTRLPRRGMVLVGTLERPKWLAFDCPCATRHRILLNLETRRRPFWRVVTTSALTIWPSVDFRADFRCHYFLKRGRVVWVRDREDGT